MMRPKTNEGTIQAYLDGEKAGSSSTGNLFFEGRVIYSYGEHFPLALRTTDHEGRDLYIANGDRYSMTTSSKHQAPLFSMIDNDQRLEIPFSALEELIGADGYPARRASQVLEMLDEIRIIDWTPDRYYDTGNISKVTGEVIFEHVLGGVLFQWKDAYYITGMDETGTARGGMFFLTELSPERIAEEGEPTSVEQAMNMLKPQAVREAEAEGQEVFRQGEWFFIKDEVLSNLDEFDFDAVAEKKYVLQNRDKEVHSHVATRGFAGTDGTTVSQVVQGIVKHIEGEHRQLKLYETGTKPKDRDWFIAHESIQGISYKANGDVD